MIKVLSSFMLLVFSTNCTAQLQDLKTYLTATKTLEFEESQAVIKELSFPGCKQYVFTSFGEISGLNFDTDIKGVKGYKAIFSCKAQNKLGTSIEKRMMAILYFDKEKKKWRVLDVREPLTTCDEYQKAKKNIDVSGAQYSWAWVSYWALMCGKLLEAKEAIETSESRARAVYDKEFYNIYSDILAKIK
jgi:hypothetical protein